MSLGAILVKVLKRDRTIVAFGLAGVVALSWIYLIHMDWGMRHMDVGMEMVIMPAMLHWTARDLVLAFLMWAVMMVAMMVPAASPVILLFAEINRRRSEQQGTLVSTGQFLSGYLTASTGFSVLATLAQWGLLTAALVSPMIESTSKALGRRIAAHSGSLSVQPSEICLSGSLPISDWVFGYGMATGLLGCLSDGLETRRLLSRLLLGIDGSAFCLWRDESLMGRLCQRLCPVGEDHHSEPIGQPP
jgi:predicted metal-binding integral membrane protein DUF2182